MRNILNKIHFVYHGWLFALFTIITISISTYYIFNKPLKYDIEFTGGTTLQVTQEFDIKNFIKKHPDAQINTQKQTINITIPNTKYTKKTPQIQSITYIGPSVSQDLLYTSIIAIILSLIAMLIYISLRFEWYFGICTIITLIHNLYITYGFICYQEIATNLHVISAILFIIGYSINDSIVIFDRIRENLHLKQSDNHADIYNQSIIQTLYRTTYTVLTTLIAPIVITILGDNDPLEHIGIISTIGIIAGAYASIFLSAYILHNLHIAKKMIGL